MNERAPDEAGYRDFARRIVDDGILTDPWIDGRPRFAAEPVVLAPEEHRALLKAGEDLAAVVDEAVRMVRDDDELAGQFLALTPAQRLMFDASGVAWHGIARADVFFTEDGPQITELNSDTPTGEPEAIVLGELALAAAGGAAGTLVDACATLASRVARLCHVMHAKLAPQAPRTAGIVYPTELTEDLSLVRLYRAILEENGWRVVLGSPYNLTFTDDVDAAPDDERSRSAALFGEPIGLMVRHYKTDWWGERQSAWLDDDVADRAPLAGPLSVALRAAVDGNLAIVNPFGAVVAQNKRLLALMWERIHRFSAHAQSAIERLIPYTARVEALHEEQLRSDRASWVLKSDYGAEGDEVVVGRLVDQRTWENALQLARPKRFIAQRAFVPLTDPHARNGYVRNHGVFVVAGEACGVYTRLDRGLTDTGALSVPTLVRQAR